MIGLATPHTSFMAALLAARIVAAWRLLVLRKVAKGLPLFTSGTLMLSTIAVQLSVTSSLARLPTGDTLPLSVLSGSASGVSPKLICLFTFPLPAANTFFTAALVAGPRFRVHVIIDPRLVLTTSDTLSTTVVDPQICTKPRRENVPLFPRPALALDHPLPAGTVTSLFFPELLAIAVNARGRCPVRIELGKRPLSLAVWTPACVCHTWKATTS